MTSKRKAELFDSVVEVLYEHLHKDDREYVFKTLLGFTDNECADCDIYFKED